MKDEEKLQCLILIMLMQPGCKYYIPLKSPYIFTLPLGRSCRYIHVTVLHDYYIYTGPLAYVNYIVHFICIAKVAGEYGILLCPEALSML